MPGTRRRFYWLLTLLAAFALCTGLQPGPVLSAKDKIEKAGVGDAGNASADSAESESKSAKVKAGAAKKKVRPETKKKKGQRAADEPMEGSAPSGNGSSSLTPTLPGAASAGSNTGSNAGSAAGTTAGASPKAPAVGRAGTQTVNKAGNVQTGGAAGNAAPGVQPGPNPDVVKKVIDVQNRNTPKLLAQKGIVGTATGVDDDGNVVIRVYTTGADEPVIPKNIENVPVVEVLTGHWLKYWQPPVFDPQLRQSRPVPIGVSAVNIRDVCGNVIATGTLGCRLKAKDGSVYALSNNHVFADENAGVIGDKIIQPGSLDEFNDGLTICDPADVIGTLFKFKELIPGGAPNIIDAAIVKTTKSMVGNSTPASPLAYGTPRTTVNNRPYIGLRVQKLGRTTGFTTGNITGLNQIVQVPYTPGLVTFVSQIEITGDVGLFAGPGDSGSLIVDMDRFPVAMLFAGAGALVAANPIQPVLDEFGMTIDGDNSPVLPPGKEARSTPNSP